MNCIYPITCTVQYMRATCQSSQGRASKSWPSRVPESCLPAERSRSLSGSTGMTLGPPYQQRWVPGSRSRTMGILDDKANADWLLVLLLLKPKAPRLVACFAALAICVPASTFPVALGGGVHIQVVSRYLVGGAYGQQLNLKQARAG